MKSFGISVMALLAVCFSISVNGQDLVILHTNDTHSQIVPQTSGSGAGLGGYERREAYIEQVRNEMGAENVLLLDAGDFSQGTPYFSIFKGDVEIELMNALGYDVVCLGNHEFDNGQAELARRVKNAGFTTLCANYDFAGTPLEGLVKDYTIVERGGKKIGIIGVLADIGTIVAKNNIKGLSYINPIDTVNVLAAELKGEKGCDLVILLSHCGYYGGNPQMPGDIDIAELTENVDIIVGDHSHTDLEEKKLYKNRAGKSVTVVQDGDKGEYVGRIELWF